MKRTPAPLSPPQKGGLPRLPIDAHLTDVRRALREGVGLVVTAPPGTGKTTRVAPAIAELDEIAGRVVLLEPRRLAAIAAARWIAGERGVELGREVGYQVRFERRWGSETRLLAATEGTLVQWLLADPVLEGVGCIVFDEVHERNVSTDLALALALRLREVREDLRLVAMSATLDADRFARLLADASGPAPLVRCEIDAYPVQVRYARRPDPRPVEQRAAGAVVGLLRELADAHRPVADGSVSGGATSDRARAEAGRREPGSILVFLPGVGEIQRCDDLLKGELAADFADVEVLPLHGSLALDRQEAALRGGRRVVLATNVAESSVTVEGVVAVVDGGLERILRFDPASGLDRIELTAVSRASADQRAGRAGRTGPGICVRVWTESEQAARVAERQPEIQRVDLAGPTLVVRAWGDDPATLRWPDPPSAAQLAHAGQLLAELGALADDTVTARGRRMAKLPLHPRLSSLVLFAAEHGCRPEGALLAALLDERDAFQRRAAGEADALTDVRSDVLERWLAVGGALNGRRDARLRLGAADAIARAARQIAASAGGRPWQARELRSDVGIQETLLRALLAAYPDRVARRREPRSPRAVMVGGHGVRLSPASRVRGEPLFVCVVIGGSTGGTTGGGGRETLVHSASGIEEAWLDARTEETAELDVESGRVRVRRRRLYRDLVLDEIDAGPAAPEHSAPLLLRWALRDPRSALGLDRPEIECFLTRVACLCEWVPELGLPDLESGLEAGTRSEALAETGFEPMSEGAAAALDALSPTWRGIVEAAVAGARTTAEITQAPVLDLLRGTIPWELQRRLDELVPERIELPSGRRAEIRYQRGEPPVLAARIQELFGWRETPRIAGGRVPLVLHLLAPNLRPQQVTDDLAGFWRRTYPEVRKELAGRYPKHPWPADGASAEPVRGAGRRR